MMAVPLRRRDVLKGALGVFATWASSRELSAQQPFSGSVRRLTDTMTVVDGGGVNVLAFFTGEGFVLVDGGPPKSFDTVMASLGSNAKVNTLFNTHHHVDQTGNNERFSNETQGTPLGRPAQAGRRASAGSSRRKATRNRSRAPLRLRRASTAARSTAPSTRAPARGSSSPT